MIPEVLAEYEDDYQFFYEAAMRKIGSWRDDQFPEEVISRILGGEHPVKVFRQYRRISEEQLARKVGLPVSYVKAVESGEKTASKRSLGNIARALRVEYSDIV